MYGTWPKQSKPRAADAIAVEHAQAPGCDQLKTIWPASPAAERRGAMMCTVMTVFM
jgi:hypothetical protein